MADAALAFLLENLKQLLSLHQDPITSDDKDELNELMDDLNFIKATLYDVCREQDRDKGLVEHEIQKIKRMVYEVEDTIDSCITTLFSRKRSNTVYRVFHPKKFEFEKVVKSLRKEKLKPTIDRVRGEFRNFGDRSSDSTDQKEQPIRIKALRQDNVVGLEEEINTLIQKLNEETNELDVLSIVGMPGLGKTTLAWNVYRDPRIKCDFPVLIWVYVSQEFNMKNVLLTILRKFTPQDMYSKSIDELTQLVCEFLKEGKFLIFVDDVWTVDAWKKFQAFLPKRNTMGKVLMTTRDASVASYANHSRPPHQLKFLSHEESVELLHIEVNGMLDETFPEDKEVYGNIIARNCEGLPLAVEVIGALLVDKYSPTEDAKSIWKTISRNVIGYLFYEDQRKNVENSISMSYKNLPYDLRDCFLYLGMFPEDTEICVWKLIQLWIAEGFIQNKYEKSLEDIAQDYLKELINKNLVLVEKTNFNGEVKTCIVHNTVREFCQTIAGYEDQNLFEEVRKSNDGNFKPSYDIIQKCRRLSVHSYVRDFYSKKLKAPNTRSFLCNSPQTFGVEPKDIASITDAFELLRVFDAPAIKFPRFPDKLFKLIHLRYITLSNDEMKMLPEVMCNLWNLQTLTAYTNSPTLVIKADITNLTHLRHVKTKASIILNRDFYGQGGDNLQTLTRLSPQSCTGNLLNKTKNLKTLGICGELAKLVDSKCLKNLHRLEKLKLMNRVYLKVASENPLSCLPCKFPKNLKFLTLSNTFLDWSHMTNTVGNIRNLEVLKLKDNALVGQSWDSVAGGFHNLRCLYIARTDLKFWTASDNSFPKLRRLALKNCEELEAVPFKLGMNLEYLSLQRVTNSAVNSARNIKQAKVLKESAGRAKGGGFELLIAPGDDN